MSFYRSLHGNLKKSSADMHHTVYYDILPALLHCRSLQLPAAAWSLIMHACMQSPDAQPREPQWQQFLTCFCLNYNWADLCFWAHFVAGACSSLLLLFILLDSASLPRRHHLRGTAMCLWDLSRVIHGLDKIFHLDSNFKRYKNDPSPSRFSSRWLVAERKKRMVN
jgi:hypothetical protein